MSGNNRFLILIVLVLVAFSCVQQGLIISYEDLTDNLLKAIDQLLIALSM